MSRLDRLEIYLDNSHAGAFTAGERVHGKLIVILNAGLKIRGIEMKVRGRAQATWKEGEGPLERCMYDTEEYIRDSVIVFGHAPEDNDIANEIDFLESGRHEYDFCFDLPGDIPPSFEGNHGFIRYWVKAKIHGMWGLIDQSGKVEFGVVRDLDLNKVPGTQEPVEDEDTCVMCSCCLGGGHITAAFKIDRRGHVPGEGIICNAEIFNGSESSITSTKIKFYRVTTYGADPFESTTIEKHTIAEEIRGEVESGDMEVWENEFICLPDSLPVTSLPGCPFIDLDYIIELKVIGEDEEMNIKIPLIVIVGTIPLQGVSSQRTATPVTSQPMVRGLSTLSVDVAQPAVGAPPMTTELQLMHPARQSFRNQLVKSIKKEGPSTPKFVRILSVVDEMSV